MKRARPTRTDPRVLIVGAGPTGLTAGVELARLGIIPRLIEKRETASGFSRAVGLLPASMEIFARSGTDAPILAEAIRFRGILFHRDARRVARIPLPDPPAPPPLLGLPQDRTEHHLAETFRRLGGAVEYATPLTGLRQTETETIAEIDGQEHRFDHVIAADGVHSTARIALGLDFPGFDLDQDWSIADVEAPDWPDPGWFQGFLLDQGRIAVVVPLEAARFRIIADTPDALAALPVDMPVTRMHRAGRFTLSIRQMAQYTHGRVAFAGDAAHCHSPIGGRGMNIGIADAADLAARIVQGDISGYHAARHPVAKRTIDLTEAARRRLTATGALSRMTITGALRMVALIPPLRRRLIRTLTDI
ncbi:FAD-dependent oxidoreductase [Alterinioella nitratireducens]|uniref:FAD-dependent oxidoreductase n=1 Tax=Alterinioella nitratireducens TaxID=2735915 RepID=UPI0040598CF6